MPWWGWLVMAAALLAVELFVIDAQFYLVFLGVSAAVVGLMVTLGSTIVPAWRARRIAPLAAMRELDVDRSGTSRARAAVGLLSSTIGVVLVAVGLHHSGTQAIRLAGLGVLSAITGVLVSAPLISRPCAKTSAARRYAG